jgi:hypothetical protein
MAATILNVFIRHFAKLDPIEISVLAYLGRSGAGFDHGFATAAKSNEDA